MWAHVLQQDGAGTVRKAVQSLPKVILVLLSMYVLSSSLYKLQVLGSSDLGRGSPTTCQVSGGGTATPSSGPPTATETGTGYTAGELLSSRFGNVQRGNSCDV